MWPARASRSGDTRVRRGLMTDGAAAGRRWARARTAYRAMLRACRLAPRTSSRVAGCATRYFNATQLARGVPLYLGPDPRRPARARRRVDAPPARSPTPGSPRSPASTGQAAGLAPDTAPRPVTLAAPVPRTELRHVGGATSDPSGSRSAFGEGGVVTGAGAPPATSSPCVTPVTMAELERDRRYTSDEAAPTSTSTCAARARDQRGADRPLRCIPVRQHLRGRARRRALVREGGTVTGSPSHWRSRSLCSRGSGLTLAAAPGRAPVRAHVTSHTRPAFDHRTITLVASRSRHGPPGRAAQRTAARGPLASCVAALSRSRDRPRRGGPWDPRRARAVSAAARCPRRATRCTARLVVAPGFIDLQAPAKPYLRFPRPRRRARSGSRSQVSRFPFVSAALGRARQLRWRSASGCPARAGSTATPGRGSAVRRRRASCAPHQRARLRLGRRWRPGCRGRSSHRWAATTRRPPRRQEILALCVAGASGAVFPTPRRARRCPAACPPPLGAGDAASTSRAHVCT